MAPPATTYVVLFLAQRVGEQNVATKNVKMGGGGYIMNVIECTRLVIECLGNKTIRVLEVFIISER